MARIGAVGLGFLLLATALAPFGGAARAGDVTFSQVSFADTAPPRVAFYDADAVLRDASTAATLRARLDGLQRRYDEAAAPLHGAIDELRVRVAADRGLPDGERRALEAELAQRTIALLVLRTEAAREVRSAEDAAVDDLQQRMAAAVAQVAGERGLAVVIRADRATRVLDEDAVDLTPLVVARVDRDAGVLRETREPEEPRRPQPSERRRTRTQSCDAGPVAVGELAALR